MHNSPEPEPRRVDTLGIKPPAAFAIEQAPAGAGVTLLVLRGELDLAAAPTLRTRLEGAPGELVIDLEAVTFIDSSALRELLDARLTLEVRHSRLVLAALPDRVRRLMDLTRTTELFETAASRTEALAAVAAG